MPDAVSGMELEKKSDISQLSCIVCCEGKQSRLPFGHAGSRSSELLGIIYSDVCGPMENASIGGSRYFILFIDDYSRMTYIYFMKQKSEAFQYFQDYKAKVENQSNRKIKTLRSDNGKEFCSRSFRSRILTRQNKMDWRSVLIVQLSRRQSVYYLMPS